MNYDGIKLILKQKFLLWCFLIISLAIFFSALESTTDYEPKLFSTVDGTGKVIQKEILTLPVRYHIYKIMSTFLFTLSVSIFIAVFIIDQIDKKQKEAQKSEIDVLQKAINENIFDSLFECLIPNEIFQVIKEDIILKQIVRRNSKWIFDFSVNENDGIELRQTFMSTAVNISRNASSYPIRFAIVKGQADEELLESISISKNGEIIAHYDHEDAEGNTGVIFKSQGNTTKIELPISIPPNDSVDITMICTTKYIGKVQDEYFTQVPIIGATLIVNIPQGYSFDVFSAMSSELKCTLKKTNKHIYEVTGGVLPKQGFVYYLNKNTLEEVQEDNELSIIEVDKNDTINQLAHEVQETQAIS